MASAQNTRAAPADRDPRLLYHTTPVDLFSALYLPPLTLRPPLLPCSLSPPAFLPSISPPLLARFALARRLLLLAGPGHPSRRYRRFPRGVRARPPHCGGGPRRISIIIIITTHPISPLPYVAALLCGPWQVRRRRAHARAPALSRPAFPLLLFPHPSPLLAFPSAHHNPTTVPPHSTHAPLLARRAAPKGRASFAFTPPSLLPSSAPQLPSAPCHVRPLGGGGRRLSFCGLASVCQSIPLSPPSLYISASLSLPVLYLGPLSSSSIYLLAFLFFCQNSRD